MSSKIIFITGTNGAGKSTIFEYLKAHSDDKNFEFHDIDENGVPTIDFEKKRGETILEILERIKDCFPKSVEEFNKISVFCDLDQWRQMRVNDLFQLGVTNLKKNITTIIFGISLPSDLHKQDISKTEFILLYASYNLLKDRLIKARSHLWNEDWVNISYLWQSKIYDELALLLNKKIIEVDNKTLDDNKQPCGKTTWYVGVGEER